MEYANNMQIYTAEARHQKGIQTNNFFCVGDQLGSVAQYVSGQLLQQSNITTKITLQKYQGMWQNQSLYKVPCQLVQEREEAEDR